MRCGWQSVNAGVQPSRKIVSLSIERIVLTAGRTVVNCSSDMSRQFQPVRLAVVLGVAAIMATLVATSAADRSPNRERLVISEVPGGLAIPGMSRRQTPGEGAFDFLDQRSSVSGVVAPGVTPSSSPMPTAKATQTLLDKMDQQKNWMFQNQLKDDTKSAKSDVEEALRIHDYDMSKTGPRKGSVQRYVEQDSQYSGSATNKNSSDDEALNGGRNSESDRRYTSPLDRERGTRTSADGRRDDRTAGFNDRGRGGNLAGRSAFEALRAGGDDGSQQGFNRGTGFGSVGRSLPGHDAEFNKFLDPALSSAQSQAGSSFNPLCGISDPVNLSPDLTRQNVNPVVPVISPDVGSRTGPRSLLDGARGLNTASSTPRPSGFLDSASRSLGGSSLAPAIVQPPRPVTMQPAVLELPRRPH